MKVKTWKEVTPFLYRKWGKKQADKILETAQNACEKMCREHVSDPREVKAHTESDLFPCISLYRSMQEHGIAKEEAERFLDQCWSKKAEPAAKSMSKVLRFTGLYRYYPAMFRWVAKKQFGEKAGFQAEFYDLGRSHCKFDMKKCLFYDTCSHYGCPELTKCFCHVDDVNNKDLHPRLKWNRTRYMGKGDRFCDFDIFLQ